MELFCLNGSWSALLFSYRKSSVVMNVFSCLAIISASQRPYCLWTELRRGDEWKGEDGLLMRVHLGNNCGGPEKLVFITIHILKYIYWKSIYRFIFQGKSWVIIVQILQGNTIRMCCLKWGLCWLLFINKVQFQVRNWKIQWRKLRIISVF